MTDLNTTEIAGVRIGGILGHGLHWLSQRVSWRMVFWAFFIGVFGIGGSVAGWVGAHHWLAARHAAALQSPIEKNTYIVEDAHGFGQYMVVRHDTTHIKLECAGGMDQDKDGNMESFSSGCYAFQIGDQIVLEKWKHGHFSDDIVYVYKMKKAVGEYDYKPIKDDD